MDMNINGSLHFITRTSLCVIETKQKQNPLISITKLSYPNVLLQQYTNLIINSFFFSFFLFFVDILQRTIISLKKSGCSALISTFFLMESTDLYLHIVNADMCKLNDWKNPLYIPCASLPTNHRLGSAEVYKNIQFCSTFLIRVKQLKMSV